ncbi:Palmitoyltransferase pfa3 [Cladophialophora carrionii]|uniref:Palmitoyltransferase n=1 Tax=Cladophialophora carrionii TaxID=86049 RepID=A0A1C1CA96_9EURO|nr:Palmitoyltransferase pfa3 [Cladophialophora carrionii]
MPSYSTPSSSPPPTPGRRRRQSCAQRCERGCCTVATYFPLAFVYSITTWAVWVVASIGFGSHRSKHVWWLIQAISLLGVTLYCLANWSYTVAAFTDPGSPLKPPADASSKGRGRYSVLPTHEPAAADPSLYQAVTVSSTGAPRFCKKCHVSKPDRTHHCSTCKRCVLKMDHHCPWLSTCLGLHNYKAFVLFLIYTSLFCWVCFANAAWWMWKELFEQSGYLDEIAPVNIILLSVIAGIIGLVLTAFTGWHLYLCWKGQTTIEKLEKTRYLSGVRAQVERNRQDQQLNHRREASEGVAGRLQRAGEQFLEWNANAVPGASRYEEGEEHTSPVPSVYDSNSRHVPRPQDSDTPALRALRRTYSHLEAERERDRYVEYLDDKDSEDMPNAFDLGWRRNLNHLFGPNPLLWALPICNTTGDGWRWEVSPKWMAAQEEIAKRKDRRLAAMMDQGRNESANGHAGYEQDRDWRSQYHYGYDGQDETQHQHQQHQPGSHADVYSRSAVSMKHLPPHGLGSTSSSDRSRRRQRRDFDRAEPFEVSSSEDDDDDNDDDDTDSDVGYNDNDAERGWARRNRALR